MQFLSTSAVSHVSSARKEPKPFAKNVASLITHSLAFAEVSVSKNIIMRWKKVSMDSKMRPRGKNKTKSNLTLIRMQKCLNFRVGPEKE